ncbi:MAG: hypothetical protein P4L50_29445 [Anaerolineaceae bacterium]|nr:hypothetical protein [Anaerolineaceae bacterium]
MAQFEALAPEVEVNGPTILSFIKGMGAFKDMFEKILADNGILEPNEGCWYSQQNWLDAFKEIANKTGPATLKKIGMNIPQTANWPSKIDSIQKALESIDVAYHMNHRGGEIGHYRFEKVNDRSSRIICDNPYPCDFDRGLIEATAIKFAKVSEYPICMHENPQTCRKTGAVKCKYLVTW